MVGAQGTPWSFSVCAAASYDTPWENGSGPALGLKRLKPKSLGHYACGCLYVHIHAHINDTSSSFFCTIIVYDTYSGV